MIRHQSQMDPWEREREITDLVRVRPSITMSHKPVRRVLAREVTASAPAGSIRDLIWQPHSQQTNKVRGISFQF